MKIPYKIEPSPKQFYALERLMDSVSEYILFGGGGMGGKSWLGCEWLIFMCLKYPGTKYFIGREELKRLRESTLMTFYKVFRYHGLRTKEYFKYNGQDHFIQFHNGSRIDLLDLKYLPSDPMYERFGSLEYTSGWIEEAGEIHFLAFDVLKTRINRWNNTEHGILGKILLTCNPKKNFLYQIFYLPHKHRALPKNHVFIQALWNDNPFRERGSEAKLQGLMDTATRERLFYGNWEYADEPDQLIPYEFIENSMELPKLKGYKKLGVDIARFGDDLTVFITIMGNHIHYHKEYAKQRLTKTAQDAADLIRKLNIPADLVGVDVVGMGSGVCDILRDNGLEIIEIDSGASSIDDGSGRKYSNLRSQMWHMAAEDIRTGLISLKDAPQLLIDDLTAVKFAYRGENTIVIEKKDDIKKRIGRSTNYGDAFVMANFVDKISKLREIKVEML